jgi:glutathione S-transferase
VPVLVHHGAVHIESNDIIAYLEKTFPQPRLVPEGHENEVGALLKHEDDLHPGETTERDRRGKGGCVPFRDAAIAGGAG